MKAILFHEHGGPEVLKYEELSTPTPGAGEVQVQLHASALNRVDLWVRNGWPGLKLSLPHVTGSDGAGIVSALGAGVDSFDLGQRVVINANIGCGRCAACLAGQDNQCQDWHLLGETIHGTLAEFVVVPARNLLALPDDIDFQTAAAAGLVYHTAWHSLIVRGQLRPGEKVLILGASGGVNTASIQIAKLAGAEVTVIGSTPEKLKLAQSLGADQVIDRIQDENWSKAAYQASHRTGFDIVVDNIGAGTMPSSLRAAKKGGRILTVGNTGGPVYEIDNRYLFAKHLSLLGSSMGTIEDFRTVMGLVFTGKLKAVIDTSFPLTSTAEAEARLEAGDQLGKIVLVHET